MYPSKCWFFERFNYFYVIIFFLHFRLKFFIWIVAFVADAAAVNPNGIKTLLVNGLSTNGFIKGKLVFINGLKSLPKNPPDCPILCKWVFDNFVLAEELFSKALWSLEICVLVNNNLWGKLVLS